MRRQGGSKIGPGAAKGSWVARCAPSAWVAPALALLVACPSCKGDHDVKNDPPPAPPAASDRLQALLEPLFPPEGAARIDTPAPMPTVEVQVGDSSIQLRCVLANAGDEPLALALRSASYSGSPLDAGIVSSPQVRAAPRGASPSTREQFYSLTIPPRSSVQLVQTVDLGEYEYSGAPNAELYWTLGYANRADRSGRTTVQLPRRWLPWR